MKIQTHNVIHYTIVVEIKLWCTQVESIPCHLFQEKCYSMFGVSTRMIWIDHTPHLLLQSWKCFFQFVNVISHIAFISLHYSSCNKLLDYFFTISQCPWSSKDRATFYPTLQIWLYNYVTTSYALAHVFWTWWRA